MADQQFKISGITCMSCVSNIEKAFYSLEGVSKIAIDKDTGEAQLEADSVLSNDQLETQLSKAGNYALDATELDANRSIIQRLSPYKPIFMVFAFITGATLISEYASGMFILETWMPNFMAGFFLVFSFFKLLDLKGFANAYSSYDIIAKRSKAYGYIYPFIELGLGLAYIVYPDNSVTHLVTGIVMFVSLIGVIQAVLSKSKIKCACLGTGFNLPMSTVTIIEDGLMLAMAAFMYFNN